MQDIEKSIYEHQNEIIEVIREGMRIPIRCQSNVGICIEFGEILGNEDKKC